VICLSHMALLDGVSIYFKRLTGAGDKGFPAMSYDDNRYARQDPAPLRDKDFKTYQKLRKLAAISKSASSSLLLLTPRE
jgi:hypothetical protein